MISPWFRCILELKMAKKIPKPKKTKSLRRRRRKLERVDLDDEPTLLEESPPPEEENPAIDQLIEVGKERGFVTIDDILLIRRRGEGVKA